MPRAASSSQCPDEYMCSFVESSPFHMIITGAGPSSVAGAWLKYAGSVGPFVGDLDPREPGSLRSKAFCCSSRTRR